MMALRRFQFPALAAFFFVSMMGSAAPVQAVPQIHARSAILFDANTGEVIYKKNDLLPTPIASTQKLLTALLVARDGNLDKRVEVEKPDTLAEPTKLYLKEGDRYSRTMLLTALLVRSANDAAVALARDNAGSVGAFAEKMNREARKLGAKNSRFVNPNGLPDPSQTSTARDLACIARAAYRQPVLRDIMNQKSATFYFADGRTTTLTNTNRVLRDYSFCNGMKTGYTILSGHCLVASGSANGREMIAVVLKSDKANVWNDAASLLEFGLGIRRDEFSNNTKRR